MTSASAAGSTQFEKSASGIADRFCGVSIVLGRMQFAVTLSILSSSAIDSVKRITALLEALYVVYRAALDRVVACHIDYSFEALLDHARDHRTAGDQCRPKIRLKEEFPIIEIGFVNRFAAPPRADRVHENIIRPKRFTTSPARRCIASGEVKSIPPRAGDPCRHQERLWRGDPPTDRPRQFGPSVAEMRERWGAEFRSPQ